MALVKLVREELLPVALFMFTASASPLGKVHGKDMGQQGLMSQELVSVGLVNEEVVYSMQTYLGET